MNGAAFTVDSAVLTSHQRIVREAVEPGHEIARVMAALVRPPECLSGNTVVCAKKTRDVGRATSATQTPAAT